SRMLFRHMRIRILVVIKRLAAAMIIALLTTSTAAVNSANAQSYETPRVNSSNAQSHETPRVTAWNAGKHVFHHRRRTAKPVNLRKLAEAQGYKKVSSIAVFPEFLPGLGVLYVKPETLPHGPLLAFDRKDGLIATVYMIPVEDIDSHKKLDLPGFAGKSDHVTFYFQSGHVGAEMPHYHIVIWNVSKEGEASVAN
ncbi:MAG: hypothetical protein ACREC0_15625, partial [Methylocella sp.]